LDKEENLIPGGFSQLGITQFPGKLDYPGGPFSKPFLPRSIGENQAIKGLVFQGFGGRPPGEIGREEFPLRKRF